VAIVANVIPHQVPSLVINMEPGENKEPILATEKVAKYYFRVTTGRQSLSAGYLVLMSKGVTAWLHSWA
jgi:hypothetical protein